MVVNLKSEFISCLLRNNISFKESDGEFSFESLNSSVDPCVLLFDGIVATGETFFWSEGFQMLSAYQGTFKAPYNIARCPDNGESYRITCDDGFCTTYSHIVFKLKDNSYILIGFTSCNKGQGIFRVYPNGRLQVLIDYFGTKQSNIQGESLCILNGDNLYNLRLSYAKRLSQKSSNINIHELKHPQGWCSWYWYYEKVTEQDIKENTYNLSSFNGFDYLLIDDGYQTHMGDWLVFSAKFPQGLPQLVNEIKSSGKKAALWVAPFIVSSDSDLFKFHKDWLATDQNGNILKTSEVTYGGWRDGDWYVLDFSIPAVREYINNVFRFFYKDLGITFFKLDALYWGSIKGLNFKNNITPIENYRLGLEVIRDATEGKAFILGCNAPLLPSVGLVHGMRLADDVIRDQGRMLANIDLLLYRLWMQEELYILDPDCLCLKNLNSSLDDRVFKYHGNSFLVLNGILMLGDRLSEYTLEDQEFIAKIATFVNEGYQVLEESDDCKTIVLKHPKNHSLVKFIFDPDNLSITQTVVS